MNRAQRERLIELTRFATLALVVTHPLPGSKVAAARDFGIDLTLLGEETRAGPLRAARSSRPPGISCESFAALAQQVRWPEAEVAAILA